MSARPHIPQPTPHRRRPPVAADPGDSTIDEQHPATRALLQHVEQQPTAPPFGTHRHNRIPRAPAPPPGGTVISLHAYRRHSAIVAGAIVSAGAMFAAWWFGS
jgi:hypothetical protein